MARLAFLVVALGVMYSSSLAKPGKNSQDWKKWDMCKKDEKFMVMQNIDHDWIKDQDAKGWYILWGNKGAFHDRQQLLTGVMPKSDNEGFGNACFASKSTKNGYEISGFGNKLWIVCTHNKETKVPECYPKDKKEFGKSVGTDRPTFVWTDHKKYAIGMRCNANGNKAWVLKSNVNEAADDETKEMVKEWAEEVGLNWKEAVEIPRENCEELM